MNKEKVASGIIDAWPSPFHNGKKGEEYICQFTLPPIVKKFHFAQLDRLGLQLSQDEENPYHCTISGIPHEAGDFEIIMGYTYDGWVKGMPYLTRTFPFAVNPDPRSLWKNTPTDPHIEYFKPDACSDFISIETEDGREGKRLVAASLRGRSHAHTGRPRDDHYRITHCAKSGWHVLAVADGAGSAPFSREGSRLACATVVQSCLDQLAQCPDFESIFDQIGAGSDSAQDTQNAELLKQARRAAYDILPKAALEANRQIRTEADRCGREAKEYATTLLLVLCKKFASGWAIASFGVGDGAMALLRHGEDGFDLLLLGSPDEGEFSGQTRFVTMNEIFASYSSLMDRTQVHLVPDFEAILLMSDGVSDAWFETDVQLHSPEKWESFWQEQVLPLLAPDDGEKCRNALLNWLDFWAPGNHDDRTIAILF